MSRSSLAANVWAKFANTTIIMMTRRVGMAVAVLLCLFVLAPALSAQMDRGTIKGQITDTTGAVIPGAQIQIIKVDTNTTVQVASDDQGLYNVPNLPTGAYRVEVTMQGFKSAVGGPIDVQPTVQTQLNFKLEVGTVSQTVTVSAEAPLLDVSTTNNAAGLTTQQVEQLPLILANEKRSITQYYVNLPGSDGGGTFNARMNGAQSGQTEVFIDGGASSEQISRGSIEENGPAIEQVGQFSVVQNSFNAEYGGFGDWFTTVTIKSGTNALHGDLYDHWSNSVLDAKPYFAKGVTPLNQHEGGFTLGGPVVIPHMYNGRNKTFFFAGLDLLFSRSGSAGGLITVPTQAMVGGDFRGLVDSKGNQIPIFDPATTQPDGKGGFVRQQFSCNGVLNVICPNRITQAASVIAPYIPPPDLPGDINNFFDHRADTWPYFNTYVPMIKVDHDISKQQKLSVTYTDQIRHRLLWGHPGEGLGPHPVWGAKQANPLDWITDQIANSWDLRVNHDYIISSNVLNHFTFSVNRYINLGPDGTDGQGWDQKLGITGIPADNGAFPQLSFSGGTATPTQWGRAYDENWHELDTGYNENLTWNRGKHTMKFGGQFGTTAVNRFSTGGVQGSFTFSNFTTSQPDAPQFGSWGSAFASFLLGDVNSTSTVIPVRYGLRLRRYALFAQDEWHVTPNLTVSYGLRWDYQPPFYEVNNKMSSFQPNLTNPGAGGLLGALAFAGGTYGRSFQNAWRRGFAPRLGIAYQLNDKTLVRASTGIYYGTTADGTSITPLGFTSTPSFASADNFTPVMNWNTQPFPQNFEHPPSTDPSFANGLSINYTPPTGDREPETIGWTFEIERQLARNFSMDISYLGNHGTHLPLSPSNSLINYVPIGNLSLGNLLFQNIDSQAAAQAGFTEPFPGFDAQLGANTVAQALKPYPQYTAVNMGDVRLPEGFSKYNSLQIKATKRISDGLSALAFFTWSKQTTDGTVQYPGYHSVGLDSGVLPLVFGANWTYELPFGPKGHFLRASSGLVSRLVSGWQVNGYLNYTSGAPLTISASNNLGPLGYPNKLANRVPGVPVYATSNPRDFNPSTSKYLNSAAFTAPSAFAFGNTGGPLSYVRGFTQKSESVEVAKNTQLSERVGLKLSADIANPFNFVRWGNPATNISSGTFGTVTSASAPRTIQINADFSF